MEAHDDGVDSSAADNLTDPTHGLLDTFLAACSF